MEKTKKEKKKADEELEVHPSEEQGIIPEEASDDIRDDMESGEKDEDIYTKEGREKLEEDAEIEPWEEGFMEGATDAGQLGKDALTGEPLMGVEDVVELELDGKIYRFVNQDNAQKFKERKSQEEE